MICILSFAEVHLKTDGGRTITPNCKNCTINFMTVGYPSPLAAGDDSSLSIYIQHTRKAVLTANVFDLGKYDIDDIHKAVAEADDLEQAELIIGCDVIKVKWSHTYRIGHELDRVLHEVVGNCSLLFVCVMSHGYRGTLRGSDGSKLLINDIPHQLSTDLLSDLPLIKHSSLFLSFISQLHCFIEVKVKGISGTLYQFPQRHKHRL